eukprot:4410558-Prymnesium_polylepis.1
MENQNSPWTVSRSDVKSTRTAVPGHSRRTVFDGDHQRPLSCTTSTGSPCPALGRPSCAGLKMGALFLLRRGLGRTS